MNQFCIQSDPLNNSNSTAAMNLISNNTGNQSNGTQTSSTIPTLRTTNTSSTSSSNSQSLPNNGSSLSITSSNKT